VPPPTSSLPLSPPPTQSSLSDGPIIAVAVFEAMCNMLLTEPCGSTDQDTTRIVLLAACLSTLHGWTYAAIAAPATATTAPTTSGKMRHGRPGGETR
jgi:hypothetical protein